MKVIELKDVKKSYGKNEILHGISLDIEEGSIHGLVGRNGCGKTTLIKCLTGIYEQDQGQILVCGEEIFENPNVKAQVGYVADSNQYFEGYHIDEMVEFYKQIYPTFDEKVFRDYNQSIGLDVSKRIKELSKGQAMSLASMLNLSIHPKVMIMDEPMSGLDVIAQKQIKDFIVNEVDMNGMSVLISSHDLKDLESFCKYDEGRKDPLSGNNGSDERTIYKITGCIWRIKKRDLQRTFGSDHIFQSWKCIHSNIRRVWRANS